MLRYRRRWAWCAFHRQNTLLEVTEHWLIFQLMIKPAAPSLMKSASRFNPMSEQRVLNIRSKQFLPLRENDLQPTQHSVHPTGGISGVLFRAFSPHQQDSILAPDPHFS